jgi:hypothetical protein
MGYYSCFETVILPGSVMEILYVKMNSEIDWVVWNNQTNIPQLNTRVLV